MVSREVTVENRTGLHARPAAAFVKEAQRFAAWITVRKGDRSADAKSILGVLSLGVNQGSRIVLEADGPNEAEAIETLVKLIESRSGE